METGWLNLAFSDIEKNIQMQTKRSLLISISIVLALHGQGCVNETMETGGSLNPRGDGGPPLFPLPGMTSDEKKRWSCMREFAYKHLVSREETCSTRKSENKNIKTGW